MTDMKQQTTVENYRMVIYLENGDIDAVVDEFSGTFEDAQKWADDFWELEEKNNKYDGYELYAIDKNGENII